MRNRLILVFFILGTACETDFPLDYSVNSNLIVVNSLLNPDSVYSISVTRSGSFPDNTGNEIITDALVEVFQNNVLVGQALFDPSLNRYILHASPAIGDIIEIRVDAQEAKLHARTTIPDRPNLTGCYEQFSSMEFPFNGKAFINIEFNSIVKQPCWIGLYSDTFDRDETSKIDSSKIIRSLFPSLYSTTFLWDRFNFINDQGIPSYEYYLRAIPELIHSGTTADLFSLETNYFFRYAELNNLDDRLGLYVIAMNASEEYDYYLKSTLINFLNNNQFNETPNPFAEQATTYSNVVNGAGVVAGYTQQIVAAHETECH